MHLGAVATRENPTKSANIQALLRSPSFCALDTDVCAVDTFCVSSFFVPPAVVPVPWPQRPPPSTASSAPGPTPWDWTSPHQALSVSSSVASPMLSSSTVWLADDGVISGAQAGLKSLDDDVARIRPQFRLCMCVFFSLCVCVLQCIPRCTPLYSQPAARTLVSTHNLVCAHGAYVRTQTQTKMQLGRS